jgi:MFS superfamily sulfate permease-like transporter
VLPVTQVGAAVSVTLIAGLFQLLMRLCRLGVIATYMSSSFISGFMTASAIQIIVSQVCNTLDTTVVCHFFITYWLYLVLLLQLQIPFLETLHDIKAGHKVYVAQAL